MRLGLVLFLLLATSSAAFSQTNLFSIRGRVVDADNVPLRRARLGPVKPDPTLWVPPVLTDGEGRFVITLPRASALRLVVTKGGYASKTVDVPRDDDSSAPELQVVLSRGAAISGRVVELSGRPAVGAPVVAQRLVAGSGTTRLTTFDAVTDDLGEYRIFGLPAGRYLVTAGMSNPFVTRTAQVPREAAATKPTGPSRTIEVRAENEPSEIDFQVEPRPMSQLTAPATPGLPPPRGVGAVRGRVLRPTGVTGEGLMVSLKGGRMTMVVMADARGCFSFEGLPSGDYAVQAPMEVTAQYGGQVGIRTGQIIRVRDEMSAATPDCEAPRDALVAAVAGVLVDDFGEPLQGALVQVLSVRYRSGRRVATPVGSRQLPAQSQVQLLATGPSQAVTDDLGRFRLSGLWPGSYVVVASTDAFTSPRAGEPAFGYLPAYYPGTSIIDGALPVQIEAGRDMFGIDMAMPMSAGARVSGVAIDESGNPLTGSVRLLASHRSGALALEPKTAPLSWPGGTFDLAGVSPGEYVVQAIGDPGFDNAARFGAVFVSVSEGDSTPVTITASTGATLEGRLVIEGARPRIDGFSIVPLPSDADLGPATDLSASGLVLHSEGTFYQRKLHGPTRFVLATAPAGWYLKSITIGGIDVTDVPFDFGVRGGTFAGAEITLSSAGASIRGAVTGEGGTSAAASSVVVFADDPLRWFDGSRHIKYARALSDGSFQIGGLPAGDYRIVAVDAADGSFGDSDWQDRRVLESLVPRARRLTLDEGQTVTTTLRPIRR